MKSSQQEMLMHALAGVSNSPLARMAARYWWVSIPFGMALYGKVMERKEKGDKIKLYHVFSDVGTILGPISAVIGIAVAADRMESKLAPQQAPLPQNVKEAEFTHIPDKNGTV